jgi:hypothetical protein
MKSESAKQRLSHLRRGRAALIALADVPIEQWVKLAFGSEASDEDIKFAENNQTALEMYASNSSTEEIEKSTKLGARDVYGLWIKAVAHDPDGKQPQFAVCQRGFRAKFKRATRNLEDCVKGQARGGLSGAKRAFFAKYPSIEENVKELAVSGIRRYKDREAVRLSVVTNSVVHGEFIKMCEEERVPKSVWPYTSKDQGESTLAAHCEELRLFSDDRGAEVLVGPKDQAALAHHRAVALVGGTIAPRSALERVEIDVETVNLFYELEATIDGRLTTLFDDLRPLAFVARDCSRSKVVVENHLFFTRAFYDEWHILDLFQKMCQRHKRLPLLPDLRYPDGPCFPSELEEWDIYLPMNIAWDKQTAQMSIQAKRQLCDALGMPPLQEQTGNPAARITIESYFSQTSKATEVAPNTSGPSTDSVARQRSQGGEPLVTAALAYELLAARFNADRPKGLPAPRIEMFSEEMKSGSAFTWSLPQRHRNALHWSLKPRFPGTIRRYGSEEPYIQVHGPRYRGPDLSNLPHLGSYLNVEGAVTLAVSENAAEAYLFVSSRPKDPSSALIYVGKVFVTSGYWSTPHKLIDRIAVSRLPDERRERVEKSGASLMVSMAHAIAVAKRAGDLSSARTLAFSLSDMVLQRHVNPLPGEAAKVDEAFASKSEKTEPQIPESEVSEQVQVKPSALRTFAIDDD